MTLHTLTTVNDLITQLHQAPDTIEIYKRDAGNQSIL